MVEIVTVSELDVLGNTLDSLGGGKNDCLDGRVKLFDRGFLRDEHGGSGFEHRLLVLLS